MVIIKEKIYGNMATVFHRTSVSDLVNKVFDSGFKPGSGDMYGKGFYSTYSFSSQGRESMKETYGPIVVKFAVPISTFFIFDYDEFKKSPNFNKLKKPSKENFLIEQFKFFKMDYSKFSQEEADFNYHSSATALWCYKNIKNFTKLCEGIIYTGQRDGQCLLAYNTKLIMPLSYTLDEGRNWEKVELNLDYLKKIAKVKNRFIPDLSARPEEFGITNYEFDENGFLNVDGNVELNFKNLEKLPFKFGVVKNDFSCQQNDLISLEGAPKKVGGNFRCDNNKLTSLKGSPEKVGGNFSCSFNKLTSLEGSPKEVVDDFFCAYNNLTSLEGAPKKVGGSFNCSHNKLTSLKWGPKEVVGSFNCENNKLISLEGSPKEIYGGFDCSNNKLTSLKGAPEKVGYIFNCSNNNLTTLEYAPKEVNIFICQENKIKFEVEDVRKVCNVKNGITV